MPPARIQHGPRTRKQSLKLGETLVLTDQEKISIKLRQKLGAFKKLAPGIQLPTLPGVQSLSIATRYLEGGRDRFVELVQAAALEQHQPAIDWFVVYADLLPYERAKVSFDDVCAAAGVKPSVLVGLITSVAMEMGRDVGNLVGALTHPQVVAASVAAAKTPGGIEDRRMLFQHHGYIPVPRSTVVTVNANASASAAAGARAESGGVPSFAEDLAAIKETGQVATRALPPAVEAEVLTFDRDAEGNDQDFYADHAGDPVPVEADYDVE